ncbi:MAG TPA: creatininase family protein [Bradyrhizobium sp.]|nr:creatininase family protein [Bradyrhizobium sp.]
MPGQAFLRAELTTNNFKSLDPERAIAVLPGTAIEQHDPQLPVMTDAAMLEDMIGR